jgi:D-erythrulose 1-phosphate 3-epimerase
MASRIHLGINTCFAVKRWPEPEAWAAIVRDDLGLDSCQFSLDLVDPLLDPVATREYAEQARAVAEARGIHIHSTFTGLAAYSWSQLFHPSAALREAAMRWYERAIDFTAQLGAQGTGGHLGAFSVRDAADPAVVAERLGEAQQRLASLSSYAAERGLGFLLFENMAVTREFGHRIAEAETLARLPLPAGPGGSAGAPLVLCLDVGHPCALRLPAPDSDYLAWLAHPWPRTPIIHVQQTDRSGDHHWPFTQERNAAGVVRADETLGILRTWPTDDDIALFLEVIPPFEADDDAVLDDLRASVAYWRSAIEQAGW